jgi:hypothetical protein
VKAAEPVVSDGGEKIAALPARKSAPDSGGIRPSNKKILTDDAKQVTNEPEALGTSVAKAAPAMPSSAFSERQLGTALVHGPAAPAGDAPRDGSPLTEEIPAGAHSAVEAAMNAADTAAAGGGAVSLRLQVGGADLSLHVELRNGEVHTTFRTDSADLRSDLARAWQASNPGSGNPSLALAAPVITTSSGSGALAGDGGSPRRGAQDAPSAEQAFAGSPPRASGSPSSSAASQPQTAAPAHSPNSVHLLTFA